MNSLCIYFGSQVISIVESKGKNPVNIVRMPYPLFSGSVFEEKVPDEVKLVTLLKMELEKNRIEIKEAAFCLSGKDLIVRHFEMPIMPAKELLTAINFEAKKYIPFKIEDLVSDFEWRLDKAIQKNHSLFVGIKKENLNRYQSIAKQLGLKVTSIEYAAFSALRLIKLNNLAEKGNIAVFIVDLDEDDEMNFVVLENGFPLFSRDMIFSGLSSDLAEAKDGKQEPALEKLKREMRISLEYYKRKFPLKDIRRIFFISPDRHIAELESFAKEMNLPVNFIGIAKYYSGKAEDISSGFIKAYGGSLIKLIKSDLKICLSEAKPGAVLSKGMLAFSGKEALFFGFRLDFRLAAFSILACVLVFLLGMLRISPLQKELKKMIASRPQAPLVNNSAVYDEVRNIASAYRQKIEAINELTRQEISLAFLLDIVPRILPEGVWLTGFSFKKENTKADFRLAGMAYLKDSSKELEAVNKLVAGLKNDPALKKHFPDINLVSLNRAQAAQDTAARFEISCKR